MDWMTNLFQKETEHVFLNLVFSNLISLQPDVDIYTFSSGKLEACVQKCVCTPASVVKL